MSEICWCGCGRAWGLCHCDCGRPAPIAVATNTERGYIQGRPKKYIQGHNVVHPTHGYSGTPTYRSWTNMRTRCNNPNYRRYRDHGGRGITVCARWESFEAFLEDMGERPAGKTLDRIDNDGNYEPGNCRWATDSEQRHNRGRKREMGDAKHRI